MTYMAIVRSLHTSGVKIIKRSDIIELLKKNNYENIRTDGISGHLLFDTDETDLPGIAEKLLLEFEQKFSIDISIQIKEAAE